MIATDFTLFGMLVSLAVCISILVFSGIKRVKIDDGNHRALLVGIVSALLVGLVFGGVHIWLVSNQPGA